MKSLGLVLLAAALALSAGGSRAQTPPPKASSADVRETLRALHDALAPLKRGDYAVKERRAVLTVLLRLKPQLAGVMPPAEAPRPRAAAWRRLSSTVDEAIRQEKDWAAGAGADPGLELPARSAEPLTKKGEEISTGFAELFPRLDAALARGAAGPRDAAAARRLSPGATKAAARATARGGAATAHPGKFFDGSSSGGGAVAPAALASGPSGARGSRPSALPLQPDRAHPLEPKDSYALRVGAVPLPAPAPAPKRHARRTKAALQALRMTAPAAFKDALAAAPGVLGRPVARAVGATAPPPPGPNAEETACRQATGGGILSATCGSGYLLSRTAPLLAGVVDAFKEQFSGSGLVMNLAFMIGGLLLGALTGGVGLLLTIVKALCGIALLWTALAMVKRLAAALSVVFSTSNNDVRHWRALRDVGKLGGELMIMVLMTFVGYKIGERPAVKNAIGSMTEALQSKLGGRVAPLKAPTEMSGGLGEEPGGTNRSNVKAPEPPAEPEAIPESGAAGRVKVTRDVGRHFYEDGVIGRRSAGIKMAHTRGKFLAALKGQGKVVGETPVPGLDGFSIVEYKFFKGDGRGNVTEALKEGEPMIKTVVDESRWSADRISALARTLFGRVPHEASAPAPGSSATSQVFVTRGRVRFVGWVDRASGKLISFGVDKILP